MSFTKEKFYNLCYENKLKKIINGIEQVNHNQKELLHVETLLQWFNEIEDKQIKISKNIEELLQLQISLKEELLAINPHLRDNISDKPIRDRKTYPLNVILHDIRSPHNTGSFFRIGDAFGVKKIYLCGITPTPEMNKKVLRTAMQSKVDFEYREKIMDVINEFKRSGIKIAGIEKTFFSKDIEEFDFDGKEVVLLFGNEEFGLTKEILDCCDSVYHIGMNGIKNSLNVSVAGGIVINFVSQRYI